MFRVVSLSVCLFLFTLIFKPSLTEALGPQNPPYGFRDLTWGIDISKMLEFKFERSDKYTKFYSRTNENLLFEGVSLKSIIYGIYENKIYSVTVHFSEQNNYELLLSNLKKNFDDYSELKSEHGFEKDVEYLWYFYYFGKGEKKHISTVSIKYNNESKQGELNLSSIQYAPPLGLIFK